MPTTHIATWNNDDAITSHATTNDATIGSYKSWNSIIRWRMQLQLMPSMNPTPRHARMIELSVLQLRPMIKRQIIELY